MKRLGETGNRWAKVAVTSPLEALARLSVKVETLLDPLLQDGDRARRDYEELLESRPFAQIAPARVEAYRSEFEHIWSSLALEQMQGGHSHDADRSLAFAVYSVVRASSAEFVVETGVARGVTSRVVLEAFRRNPQPGRLVSVDLPPLSGSWESAGRTAVPVGLRSSWTYLRGTSRQVLPRIAKAYPVWDVFVHDSGHTFRNMRMEFELAKPSVRPGGWLLADDIEDNPAFRDIIDLDPEYRACYLRGAKKNNIVGVAQRHSNADSGA
jgi:predicted O-methyltransferase YrrM